MDCARRRGRPCPAAACCRPTAPALAEACCPLFARRARRSGGRPRPLRERSSCYRLDRLDDVLIAGAAADVSLERVPNLVLGRTRVLSEQAHRGEHHPARAIAALKRVVLVGRLLQWM